MVMQGDGRDRMSVYKYNLQISFKKKYTNTDRLSGDCVKILNHTF